MILKGINNIGDPEYSNTLASNLINMLDYGFVDAGGYFNVTSPTSGLYGGDFSSLRQVNDPRYPSGTIWEGYRKNWVWENSLTKSGNISISGVYINNRLHTSGYSIDYPNGRIIFNSPLNANSSVKVNYSYKWIQVCDYYDEKFKRYRTKSFRVDDTLPFGSGKNIEFSDSSVQLPAIGVQVLNEANYTGYELGSSSKKVQKPIIFHVIGENSTTVSHISDILAKQAGQSIMLFDPKAVASRNAFPLMYNGTLNNPSSIYPNLIKASGDGGYRWTNGIQNGSVYLSRSNPIMDKDFNNFHAGIVRVDSEAIVYS